MILIFIRNLLHYGAHFILPAWIAKIFYSENRIKSYLILLSTMLIDADHLLTKPIFDACRCSIEYHPFHNTFTISLYYILLFPKQTRILGIGLCLHIVSDFVDCLFIRFVC